MNNARPRLSFLTEKQIHQAHHYALRELFRQRHGIHAEGLTVRIPPEIVEAAIASAPKQAGIY